MACPTTPTWILLPYLVGILTLLRTLTSFLAWIYRYFLRPPKSLTLSYGSWALVTGPTDGIGKALALELARHGLNLILVARNPAKLAAVSSQIGSVAPVEIRTLVLDFSTEDPSRGVSRLREVVDGLDVGVVVNNAGTTYPTAMYFHEVGEELWTKIVKVNLEGTTMVTRAVIPGMVERGRGAVVCIGSGSAAALPSFPLFDIYASTKAYVDQLCRSLHVEYAKSGIDVQCQIPMYVATKMVPHRSNSFFIPKADGYARSAMRWIGYEQQCAPHWTHSIQCWLISLVPDFILNASRLRHGINRRRRELLEVQATPESNSIRNKTK